MNWRKTDPDATGLTACEVRRAENGVWLRVTVAGEGASGVISIDDAGLLGQALIDAASAAKVGRDENLYEICPMCNGTGMLPRDPQGFTRECYCKPLRVVAVGVTTWALDRMARREISEAEQRAGFDRVTSSLAPAAEPKPKGGPK